MKLPAAVIRDLRVRPGEAADLSHRPTVGTTSGWPGKKGSVLADLDAFKKGLESAQEVLYASDTWAVLLIFQALDAAGKDGTIKHVMSGVNPQGCEVFSFKQPSTEELKHDFLWRCSKALPERGRIGIFNRSYYEEVLIARVHPQIVDGEHLPAGTAASGKLWKQRYEDINCFERHLERNGTRVVKFYLHVSKEEQARRFLARLDDPAKQWKFSLADLAEREHFDDYTKAYEKALTATSTKSAPWHVIPADDKPVMRALVAGVVVDAVGSLGLSFPRISKEQAAALGQARRKLTR